MLLAQPSKLLINLLKIAKEISILNVIDNLTKQNQKLFPSNGKCRSWIEEQNMEQKLSDLSKLMQNL